MNGSSPVPAPAAADNNRKRLESKDFSGAAGLAPASRNPAYSRLARCSSTRSRNSIQARTSRSFDTQFEELLRQGHTLRVVRAGTPARQPGGEGRRARPRQAHQLCSVHGPGRRPARRQSAGGAFSLADHGATCARPRRRQWRRAEGARARRLPCRPDALGRARPAARPHPGCAAAVPLRPPPLPGPPIAFYYHGGEIGGHARDRARRRPPRPRAADVVFTNTESSKAHVIARGCDAAKVHVIPVGFKLPTSSRRRIGATAATGCSTCCRSAG